MSRTKIVKKHGHYIKKRVRRLVPWKDEMISHMGIQHHALTDTPRFVVESLEDADFIFWLLFAISQYQLRLGYVYSKVTPEFEGRGVAFHIFGEPSSTRTIYNRINELFSRSWAKWLGWGFRIEAVAFPSTRVYLPTSNERRGKGDLSIELRIYPPLDTVAYDTCKDLWKHCTHEGQCTSSTVLELMYHALERRLAKKRREREGEVPATPHI
jgi:hypothetical protein